MKLFVNSFAAFTVAIYTAVFLFLLSSLIGCQGNSDTPAPEEKAVLGLGSLIYEPTDSDPGAFTVTAGLCKNSLPAEPQNITVDVFTFSPTTDPSEALRQITDMGTDKESEEESATDIVEADQSFPVWVSTTDNGNQITNFQADKTFVFSVDAAMLIVVRLTDEAGKESFTTFKTDTGNSLKTCLHL